jgi:hypothetical protein
LNFWLAAASPQPLIEDQIADKVVAIRDAAIDDYAVLLNLGVGYSK